MVSIFRIGSFDNGRSIASIEVNCLPFLNHYLLSINTKHTLSWFQVESASTIDLLQHIDLLAHYNRHFKASTLPFQIFDYFRKLCPTL